MRLRKRNQRLNDELKGTKGVIEHLQTKQYVDQGKKITEGLREILNEIMDSGNVKPMGMRRL